MVVTSVACLAMVYGMFKSILHPDGDASPAARRQHGQQGYDFRKEQSQQPKYERSVAPVYRLRRYMYNAVCIKEWFNICGMHVATVRCDVARVCWLQAGSEHHTARGQQLP